MLFRISGKDADKVSYILGKNPDKIFEKEVSGGTARLYYLKYESELVEFAFDVEMDAITELKEGNSDSYVNDRPFIPSTFLTVAMNNCIKSALNTVPEYVWDIEVEIPNLSVKDSGFPLEIFEPLGYETVLQDQSDCDNYKTLILKKNTNLSEVLNHIYILVPLFDGKKHYIINDNEAHKLIDKTESWLRDHPKKDWILKRFLGYRKGLISLVEDAIEDDEDILNAEHTNDESTRGHFVNLHESRHIAVLNEVQDSVFTLEIGCGTGKFLGRFNKQYPDKKIYGIDYSSKDLFIAKKKCKDPNITIKFGSAVIGDQALHGLGFDTIVMTEVIEHIDPDQMFIMWSNIKKYKPKKLVITTPNKTYNKFFPGLKEDQLRHWDHRFEFTRGELTDHLNAYFPESQFVVKISGVGEEKEGEYPSSLAVITSKENAYDIDHRSFYIRHESRILPEDDYYFKKEKLKSGLEEYHFHGVHPKYLWYIPPTISPAETVIETGVLEHPSTAISYYASKGITNLMAQEKHMGSRGIIVLRPNGDGMIYTRSGKKFFDDETKEKALLSRIHIALHLAGISFYDAIVIDAEIMPWNLKAHGLIERQFKPMFVAGLTKFQKLSNALKSRYPEISTKYANKISDYELSVKALNQYIGDKDDIKIAPFAILKWDAYDCGCMSQIYHMTIADRLSVADPGLFKKTQYTVDIDKFEEFFYHLTNEGGEGIVIKPYNGLSVIQNDGKMTVPGIKVRGKEYLRIIYGPEYLSSLEKLQRRPLGRKRMLSALQHKLAMKSLATEDAMERFNICMHSLSLNAEPIDPRL